MSRAVYLDYNATTPLAPEVVRAMRPYLTRNYGNPSSSHWAGTAARDAVETARAQVAALLSCDPTEVVFTSGGTEANNHAIKGLFFARAVGLRRDDAKQHSAVGVRRDDAKKHSATGKPFHIVTSRVEHPAVLEPCRFLESLGAEVTYLPVDRYGLVDPDDVRRALRPSTQLVSIMHANNEVGTIQPIGEIAAIAREREIVMHTDAAQSVGKVAVDVDSLGVDLLSVAGHKVYAPKGVGALYVRDGVELAPFMHGAGHEAGRRAGTENVLAIVGLGAACAAAARWVDRPSIRKLRDYFWTKLQAKLGERVVLNGHPERRLPNTLNVGVRGARGDELLARMPRVAASTGSACHAGSVHTSPVLAAMGVEHDVAAGALRFSLGRKTTRAEIDAAIRMLVRVVDGLT